MSQQNKVALVTGASRGIGHAIAFALGRTGITLIGTATTQEGADKITQVLKTAGMLGCGMMLNITQQDSINATIEAIKKQYAAPDILVNNAAITQDNLFLRMKED